MDAWMIYGANGYTGQLIAELARERGLKPILAGRTREKLAPLAARLGLETRAFSLDDAAALRAGLAGVKLVLHCAGPFSVTSRPMVAACLEAGAHYLDITGEMAVLAAVFEQHEAAQAKKVSLLSGVGFDVVPSDCLALLLREGLPGAVRLELAFATSGRPSAGTLKTMIEGLPMGSWVRRGGKLERIADGSLVRRVAFADRERDCMAIPWGDLASAWRSTAIPDITVYMGAPKSMIRASRLRRFYAPLLGLKLVQRFLQARVEKNVRGPSAEDRARGSVQLWGRAEDASGRALEGWMTTPEGYAFTAAAALECALRTLAGKVPPGAWTPAQAFGSGFAAQLPGVTVRPLVPVIDGARREAAR